jgi:hypothetical protein
VTVGLGPLLAMWLAEAKGLSLPHSSSPHGVTPPLMFASKALVTGDHNLCVVFLWGPGRGHGPSLVTQRCLVRACGVRVSHWE